jgi:molybdopterin-binding protein
MNQFFVRVMEVAHSGEGEVLVRLESPVTAGPALVARITWRSQQRLGLDVGRNVYARVKSVALLD